MYVTCVLTLGQVCDCSEHNLQSADDGSVAVAVSEVIESVIGEGPMSGEPATAVRRCKTGGHLGQDRLGLGNAAACMWTG